MGERSRAKKRSEELNSGIVGEVGEVTVSELWARRRIRWKEGENRRESMEVRRSMVN